MLYVILRSFMLLHTTLLSWWVGWSYFTMTTCTCLIIWEPVGTSVRLVHPRTWFKPPMANCFATDRSKAVTPKVLFFVNCGVRHWNWYSYKNMLCFLSVAIPDMHISLFSHKFETLKHLLWFWKFVYLTSALCQAHHKNNLNV